VPDVCVDALIVSFNTCELLRECLASVRANAPDDPGIELRISVLDNGSSDGSADMVANEFPDVRLIRSSVNLGFAMANNALAATSCASHLLLLNSDTLMSHDVVTPLLDALESDPAVAIAAPRLVYPDGEVQASSERLPTLRFELAREIRGTKLQPLLRPLFDVDAILEDHRRRGLLEQRRPHDAEFLWATCWLVRRPDFPGGSLFDASFALYDEDLDACRRITAGGRRLLYVPEAEIVHLGGRSSATSASKLARMRSGRARYYRRHHGARKALAYRATVAGVDLMKRVRSGAHRDR
jgi:N-acetylglucosaminyl-diphospho-decaprenol L-rhamnosyltransferase